ncbi:DUF2313 domain-containing protein [Roseomonas eburnea]|uniref:DUF2313 domain-containing protein n=1 Tax=Neoroseomonas eburnea TaxID=1346889 RepID=A0A9X9XDW5_9PROT|nr:putative phage tail protein [Neoroseomonas eburnea]MBR0681901.1 DUF2313 domain-containing protein [Neoroseomonas eburnea]
MISGSAFAELPVAVAPDGIPPLPAVIVLPEGPRAARSVSAIQAELLDLLPTGWAWSRDLDTTLASLLLALAQEIERFEVSAEAMLPQVDPRVGLELLEDFERVLGPDPCGRDLVDSAGGLDDRRRAAHVRWTQQGYQTPAYYIALAGALGVEITIAETTPAVLGVLECGMELAPAAERFVWVVSLPETRVIEPELGVLECGGFLGELVPSLVECVIRQLAPAHTTPVFSYAEAS